MKAYHEMKFHPLAEEITQKLCELIQNRNPTFFRVLVNYHLTKMASMMRVNVATRERGVIPINMYAINLAPSGQGKGYSTNIIEDILMPQFRDVFVNETLPVVEEEKLAVLAVQRATINNTDPDAELAALQAEYVAQGMLPFAFDYATGASIKQTRHKLLLSQIGSMNLEIDEIGNNLTKNSEVLGTYLELFDVGKIKQKLTKNTRESQHVQDIVGKTPANLLCFGTPSKLLDGSKTEDEFYSMLDTGYARRCFFGYTRESKQITDMTPEEVYDTLCDSSKNKRLSDISQLFGKLASIVNYNKTIQVQKNESVLLIEYRQNCEIRAGKMGEYDEIKKAEMSHRYFKALKLAGTYAFIDGSPSVQEDHLYAAILTAEESGEHLSRLLKRDRNYVKLAKYIAAVGREVTHVDLTEDLPFYKGGAAFKAELMTLATAWGYKNRIIIKKHYTSGIEFLTGETLKPTDLEKIPIAYSTDYTVGYNNTNAPFDKLHGLLTKPNLHWINHHLTNGHRHNDNIKGGFSVIVLDVDSGVPVKQAVELLKEYKGVIHTTKRHTPQKNRFRIIMPLSFEVKLDAEEFKEFMRNIYEWLPFDVDTGACDRARKWATHNGQHLYLKGDKLIDAMDFIPKTTRNDERKAGIIASMSNLERWFINNTGDGNRNNQYLKYAMMMVDSGASFNDIRTAVIELNNKLPDKISAQEIETTVLQSVAKKISKKA